MKAFGWFFLFAVMAFAADLTWAGDISSYANSPWLGFSLACDSSTARFDIITDGANITHVFVDSGCEASASEYALTVDGTAVQTLYTNGGPCKSISRDVWFPLQGNQDTVLVCVSVQRAGAEDIQDSIGEFAARPLPYPGRAFQQRREARGSHA